MLGMKYSSEVEVHGHLIDSMILTKIFDVIMDLGGEFEVLEMRVGKKKKDTSYAKLQIQGKNQAQLNKILEQVYRVGAIPTIGKQVVLKAAPKDMVMPDNFYSTTNNTTQILHKGKWITVENMMMDKCIVVKNGSARCMPIREIKKGDMVVVGEMGVKIIPPERPREGSNVFEFMGSSSSSERPTQHIAKKVAQDIYRTKKQKGKIVLVGGPAIVHTGAADSVADLIRLGYIDGVLAGNALAVHDIEYATLGTSLGMNVHDGSLAVKGHRNHMDTINAVFKAGSIANMVKTKKLTKGIMYECIRKNIPFVLAGSIRDDGPLPDVITDVSVAQKKYKEVLKDAKIVIMISTMLHSIATGNMIPANVKVIVVDINQPTVTKLMDRGTWQALGIVTDVGAFLPLVAQEIKKLH
jgi:lysine-ketoglutarate reductase/saccharopine dehydrogenase-like protein (TIGR00300 family)